MSPFQALSNDFPRLIGTENFDVWKTCEESDESASNVSDFDDAPKPKSSESVEVDSDAVDSDAVDSDAAGAVLPANFAFKGNSKRDHPDRNSKNWNQKQTRNNSNNNGNGGNSRRDKNYAQGVPSAASLIAVATTANPPISLTAQANDKLDPTWTIDSGCTRHVTHGFQWFADISTSGGSITVGGNNQIPIEGIGRVELAVVDSKGNSKALTLHSFLYAPQLHFNLLSVPAAVKRDYRFNFDRKHCAVQTDQFFKLKAITATNTDLYQFQVQPKITATALMTKGAKPSMDSIMLRLRIL
ncbi:Copia protein [Phytophthora palmivora]|uniref:Copia protein n=1 Tax=Phytophthora palmivora TaxID=4796 RepID=A0A2P4WWY8_9STRA|nr:Copia protein [Phytophthora palmivora]